MKLAINIQNVQDVEAQASSSMKRLKLHVQIQTVERTTLEDALPVLVAESLCIVARNVMLGITTIFILTLWILLEVFINIWKSPKYLSEKFGHGEDKFKDEVKITAERSLNLGALTFAGISLILGGFGKNLTSNILDSLIVFSFGLMLFIISYKLEVCSATIRIYRELQQRIYNFGILSLVFGLFIFFINKQIYEFSYIFGIMTLIIIIIHIYEYFNDYKTYRKIRI